MQILKTKTEDGLTFTGILSEPTTPTENIIIHTHGMSGDIYMNSFYPAMHKIYPEHGWAFLAGENRGTHIITQFDKNDETVNIGNAYEIFEDCAKDIRAWIDEAKKLGYKNIWLQGHSLGPSKIAYFVSITQPTDIAGLILISPSDMLGLVHDPVGSKDHEIMLPEAKKLVSEDKADQILSHELWDGVKLSAKTYLNFFDDGANTAIFNYKNPALGFEKVNSIKLPVIAFSGTKDDGIATVMNPYRAMEMLEAELTNSPRKKTVVFEEAEHDFSGFGEKIVEEVLEFIKG